MMITDESEIMTETSVADERILRLLPEAIGGGRENVLRMAEKEDEWIRLILYHNMYINQSLCFVFVA